MKNTSLSLAVAAALLGSANTFADTNEESALDVVTVIANRVETPIRQISTSIETLTEEEIEALGNVTVADVLRSATAINVSNSGGLGKSTTLRIRGEEGYRTKLLIDGVELSDPSAPQIGPIFDDIVANDVSHIDVLRGPQGLAYGADAGGIVSIQSKLPEEGFSGNVSAEAGSFSTQRFNGRIAAGSDIGGVSVSVSDTSTDGLNARTSDTSEERDGYENTTLHLNGRVNITDGLVASLTIRDIDAENQYDACFDNATFAQINACHSTTGNTTSRLGLAYKTDSLSFSGGYSETDVDRRNFSNNELSFTNQGEISKLDFLGSVDFGVTKLVFGADRKRESLESTDAERDQNGVFIEAAFEPVKDFFINVGTRYDDNDTFGSHVSKRLGSAYILDLSDAGAIKFKGSLGTGFRAPSLFEQGYNDGPFAYGAAAGLQLKEETSEGLDVGVEYFADNGFQIGLVWFDQEIQDEIVFDGVAYQGYLQYAGVTKSEGLELSLKADITDSTQIRANYTYNDTESSNLTERLRRPEHVANIFVTQTWLDEALNGSLLIRTVKDAVDVGAQPLDDYTVVNAQLRYQITDMVGVHLRLENLLDRDYQEVTGFNTAERSAYAGVKLNF